MNTNLWSGLWQGRAPSGDAHRRARQVISPSGGIIRGKFPSRKNGRMVHHEGLLELEAAYLFEASPHVSRYREQPLTIHYPDGSRLRRYTPDFELLLTTGASVLVEVKPIRSLEDEEVRHKLDCVAAHFERASTAFMVLTDEKIRFEPRLSNLRWVYHHAGRVPPTQTSSDTAVAHCAGQLPMTIRQAGPMLALAGVNPCSLLMSGHLRCPLHTPVSETTLITLAKEADDGWFWIAQEHGF